ncbi:uncharacterized protein C8Q71DRAFT_553285 [Rhodofomes roseus]|uniref:Uncharacterized protein n=1 Tax=Rhodofomes roseus TaxID=34475 RepID=A0ABQ8KI13_9APHY|nr:uncharacterized protein C8Q71DRAFT_553285 [Rhodofomes roseus]KAH9837613.1 hypothetical protein C8Q71DRAFT_553285 [Rhodofomes roseus]
MTLASLPFVPSRRSQCRFKTRRTVYDPARHKAHARRLLTKIPAVLAGHDNVASPVLSSTREWRGEHALSPSCTTLQACPATVVASVSHDSQLPMAPVLLTCRRPPSRQCPVLQVTLPTRHRGRLGASRRLARGCQTPGLDSHRRRACADCSGPAAASLSCPESLPSLRGSSLSLLGALLRFRRAVARPLVGAHAPRATLTAHHHPIRGRAWLCRGERVAAGPPNRLVAEGGFAGLHARPHPPPPRPPSEQHLSSLVRALPDSARRPGDDFASQQLCDAQRGPRQL